MYNRMPTSANQYQGGGTKTVNMFSKLMSQGSQFVMEGVKNLVVKKHVSLVFGCDSECIDWMPSGIDIFFSSNSST